VSSACEKILHPNRGAIYQCDLREMSQIVASKEGTLLKWPTSDKANDLECGCPKTMVPWQNTHDS